MSDPHEAPAGPRLGALPRLALFLLAYVVLSLGGQAVLLFVVPPTQRQPPGLVLGWYSGSALVFMGLTWLFWTRVDRRPWAEIGFDVMDGKAWRRALPIAAWLIAPPLVLAAAFGAVRFDGWAVEDPGQGLTRGALHAGSAVAAAVSVELPFLGYVFGNLRERMSSGRLALAMAVLYAVSHLWLDTQRDLLNVVNTMLVGAGLTYLRLAGASTALPIAVSALGYLITFLLSSDPWMEPLLTVRYLDRGYWFGRDWYAGLTDVWVALFWLVGVYAWVYRCGRVRDGGMSARNDSRE